MPPAVIPPPRDEADEILGMLGYWLLAACLLLCGVCYACRRASTKALVARQARAEEACCSAEAGATSAAALISAAIEGNVDAVERLLQAGVPIDSVSPHGTTALHHAAVKGHRELVEYLVSQDANRMIRDQRGRTAEECARKMEQDDLADMLRPQLTAATLKTRAQWKRDIEGDRHTRYYMKCVLIYPDLDSIADERLRERTMYLKDLMNTMADKYRDARYYTLKVSSDEKSSHRSHQKLLEDYLRKEWDVTGAPCVLFIQDNQLESMIRGAKIPKVTNINRKYVGLEWARRRESMTREQMWGRVRPIVARQNIMVAIKGAKHAPLCGFSRECVELLNSYSSAGVSYGTYDIMKDDEMGEMLKAYYDWPTFPQVYCNGELIGGLDILKEFHEAGTLKKELLQG